MKMKNSATSSMSKENRTLKSECESIDKLQDYLREKAKKHHNYKHYVPDIDRIYNIYHEGALFLTDGSNWNDPNDKKAFTDSNSGRSECKRYGLCLSFSKSESVAMWMLYGGMQKKGAMIDINPKSIKQLLDTSNRPHVELGNFEKGHWNTVIELNENEYEVELTDILYYDANKNADNEHMLKYDIKRSDASCSCDYNVIDNAPFLQKKVWAWNYENECRLIVEVDTNSISSLTNSKISAARVEFPNKELFRKDVRERILLAPNFDERSIVKGDFIPRKSALKIDWDLCKDCPKNKQTSSQKAKD